MSFDKSSFVYTSCYCEENVWKFCDTLRNSPTFNLSNHRVVFVSNTSKTVPFWKHSKENPGKKEPVVWDYHVISIQLPEHSQPAMVFDFDVQGLPFPCEFSLYTEQVLQPGVKLRPQYHRWFRVLTADEYLRTFASDRSHMRHAETREWLAPPPSYPCIHSDPSTPPMNLPRFWDMARDSPPFVGRVLSQQEFVRYFTVTGESPSSSSSSSSSSASSSAPSSQPSSSVVK